MVSISLMEIMLTNNYSHTPFFMIVPCIEENGNSNGIIVSVKESLAYCMFSLTYELRVCL